MGPKGLKKELALAFWVHWIMRVSCAWEFIGHGSFGILTKTGWLPYITVFGFSERAAWKLMPYIGSLDIFLGILVLFLPLPMTVLYMAIWGVFTALLRPLSGESFWEFFERSYNYGLPLLFYYSHRRANGVRALYQVMRPEHLAANRQWKNYGNILVAIIVCFLFSHGAFSVLMGKQNLLYLYWKSGLPLISSHQYAAIYLQGCVEMLLAVTVYLYPNLTLLAVALFWKMGTEFLYVSSNSFGGIFEFIERGSSYGSLLALMTLVWSEKYKATALKPIKIKTSLGFLTATGILCGLLHWNWNARLENLREKKTWVSESELVDRLRQGGYWVHFSDGIRTGQNGIKERLNELSIHGLTQDNIEGKQSNRILAQAIEPPGKQEPIEASVFELDKDGRPSFLGKIHKKFLVK